MNRPHLSTATLALLILAAIPVLGAARSADACSCAWLETDFLAPVNGATDVPTNARVWIGSGLYWGEPGDAEFRIELLDGDGVPVAVSVTDLMGYNDLISVLTPSVPLQAGETYRIRVDGDETLGTFTVGSGEDTSPPEVPVEEDRTSSADARIPNMMSSCGYSDVVTLTLGNAGLVQVANIEGADALDTDALEGESSDLSVDGQLRIGSAGCTWSWPDAEPGASTTVRWGAYDIAGNFSGWSEPEKVTIPPAGCSCVLGSATTQAAPLAALLLALSVLAIRRRAVWRRSGTSGPGATAPRIVHFPGRS